MVSEEGGGGLADSAAVAVEPDLGDPAVVVDAELEVDLVAAEGVVQVADPVRALEPPSVGRGVVVIEDLLAVEGVVHSCAPSRRWLRRSIAIIPLSIAS